MAYAKPHRGTRGYDPKLDQKFNKTLIHETDYYSLFLEYTRYNNGAVKISMFRERKGKSQALGRLLPDEAVRMGEALIRAGQSAPHMPLPPEVKAPDVEPEPEPSAPDQGFGDFSVPTDSF